ncbi:unnamed protein product [Kuraishia capsulata CBS 1993]|uniref:EamA domain-containing protein n=1 Tax=Kuraishia capsulata CBS 1993 TaxID=1382522 RepID=W6MY08_9ASCO|nr:uncharacterized protein KUCA_T00005803001 [Kuraishia capsulata CBS 1993]CDK29810.1 unnamed protein product [Kuraishia capsulata CBS 1993]
MQLPFIVAGTVITGCLNSIFTKYQDNQCVAFCDDPVNRKLFEQPVLQTLVMFVGESGCWLFVLASFLSARYTTKYQRVSETTPLVSTVESSIKTELRAGQSFVLAVPAICDICGTTLLNLGLLYTPVSVYQMTRGTLILFVALFSVLFLNRKISRIEWTALFVVVFGVFLVGLASGGNGDASDGPSASSIAIGMSMIFIGEIFSASQFVVEEYIMSRWTMVPVKLVGWEGTYGFGVTLLGMLLMDLAAGNKGRGGPFDVSTAFYQLINFPTVWMSSVAIMFSIGSFNFFGLSLTDRLSATARSTIDTSRTLLVWIVSLALGWESFKSMQLLGFVLLVFGTLVFNGVIQIADWKYVPQWIKTDSQTRENLLINVVDEQIERM